MKNNKKDVFITYSWDNEEHKSKVLSFTNYLRDNGFEAEVDRLMTQKESAIDLNKMMHQIMTSYEKVIIVLSKGYKQKASAFKGGVGNEYNLIIKDIEDNTKKYILVSFEKISNDIIPLFFKGREIVDLTNQKNTNVLFSKLLDKEIINFSEVNNLKPKIKEEVIKPFYKDEKELKIVYKIPEIKFEFDINIDKEIVIFKLIDDEFDKDKIPYIKKRAQEKKDDIFKVVGNIDNEKLNILNNDWQKQSVLETIDEIKKKLQLKLTILFFTNHSSLVDYKNINRIIHNVCNRMRDWKYNNIGTKLDVYIRELNISFGIRLTENEIKEISKINSNNRNEVIESLRYNLYEYSASDLSEKIVVDKLIPAYIEEMFNLFNKQKISFEKFNWNYIDSYKIGLG